MIAKARACAYEQLHARLLTLSHLSRGADYDWAGGSGDGPCYTGRARVTGSDPYDLDSDIDRYRCE